VERNECWSAKTWGKSSKGSAAARRRIAQGMARVVWFLLNSTQALAAD